MDWDEFHTRGRSSGVLLGGLTFFNTAINPPEKPTESYVPSLKIVVENNSNKNYTLSRMNEEVSCNSPLKIDANEKVKILCTYPKLYHSKRVSSNMISFNSESPKLFCVMIEASKENALYYIYGGLNPTIHIILDTYGISYFSSGGLYK